MEDKNLKPVSWGYFWGICCNGEYEVQTADNCCCSSCKYLGFHNFNDFKQLNEEVGEAVIKYSSGKEKAVEQRCKEINKRIDKQREFYSGPFVRHMKNTSGCGSHCLRCNLTSSNDERFAKPCDHERDDDVVVEPQETVEDAVKRLYKKKATRDNWNGSCEFCGDHGEDDESGNLYLCKFCNIVGHKKCIQRTCNDLPLKGGDKWICIECTQQNDSVRHSSSCEECNEFGYIVDDVKLQLNLLEHLESHAEEVPSIPLSPMFRARLDKINQKFFDFRAHKIRHRNQDCFKPLVLENLTLDSCYLLVDYWAKLKAQDSSTETCGGGEAGISVHGLMFIYLNPSSIERKQISECFPEVDWDRFGPASDEGGDKFLNDYLNEFSDNSKQTAYHTACGINAGIEMFMAGRPWLRKDRSMFLQSDGAINYRDPTTEIDVGYIVTRLFSEAGEGKDKIDANCARVKRVLIAGRNRCVNTYNNGIINIMFRCVCSFVFEDFLLVISMYVISIIYRGRSQRTAKQYHECAEEFVIAGNTNLLVMIDDSVATKGAEERQPVPDIRYYGIYSIDPEEETVTFWESLDPEESEKSISTTGRAVGYGPGVVMSISDFDDQHRTRGDELGVAIVNSDTAELNCTQLKSREEKKEAQIQSDQKKFEKQRKREEKAAVINQLKRSQDRNLIYQCNRCCQTFLKENNFVKHQTNASCIDKAAQKLEKERQTNVRLIKKELDTSSKKENADRVDHLAYVSVKLSPSENRSIGIGWSKVDEDTFVVDSLDVDGLAFQSATIDEGFVLARVNEVRVESVDCLEGKLTKDVNLLFRRKCPPPPIHGSARKNFRKDPNFKYHPEQIEWLKGVSNTSGHRSTDIYGAMRLHFGAKMRDDTSIPTWMCLESDQIDKWFKDLKKNEKDKKKAENYNKRKEKEDKEVIGEEEPENMNKRKKKANKAKTRKLSQEEDGDRNNKRTKQGQGRHADTDRGKRKAAASGSGSKEIKRSRDVVVEKHHEDVDDDSDYSSGESEEDDL